MTKTCFNKKNTNHSKLQNRSSNSLTTKSMFEPAHFWTNGIFKFATISTFDTLETELVIQIFEWFIGKALFLCMIWNHPASRTICSKVRRAVLGCCSVRCAVCHPSSSFGLMWKKKRYISILSCDITRHNQPFSSISYVPHVFVFCFCFWVWFTRLMFILSLYCFTLVGWDGAWDKWMTITLPTRLKPAGKFTAKTSETPSSPVAKKNMQNYSSIDPK